MKRKHRGTHRRSARVAGRPRRGRSGCGRIRRSWRPRCFRSRTCEPAGQESSPSLCAFPDQRPKLQRFAQEFKAWALEQTRRPPIRARFSAGSRVLPQPGRSSLRSGGLRAGTAVAHHPYHGPGVDEPDAEEKEAVAARAFRTLSEGIDALKLDRRSVPR